MTLSTITIRELDERDNESALALLETRNAPDFRIERSPDFFSLAERFGKTVWFGSFDREHLIATLAVSEGTRFVNGAPVQTFYVHDARVHPTYSGQGVFRALVGEARRSFSHVTSLPLVTTTILAANEHASIVFRAAREVNKIIETTHAGFLVKGRPREELEVLRLSEEDYFIDYQSWAPNCNLSPTRLPLQDSFAIEVRCSGKRIAVGRCIDESRVRRYSQSGRTGKVVLLGGFAFSSRDVDAATYGQVARVVATDAFWTDSRAMPDAVFVGCPASEDRAADISFASVTYSIGPQPTFDARPLQHDISLV